MGPRTESFLGFVVWLGFWWQRETSIVPSSSLLRCFVSPVCFFIPSSRRCPARPRGVKPVSNRMATPPVQPIPSVWTMTSSTRVAVLCAQSGWQGFSVTPTEMWIPSTVSGNSFRTAGWQPPVPPDTGASPLLEGPESLFLVDYVPPPRPLGSPPCPSGSRVLTLPSVATITDLEVPLSPSTTGTTAPSRLGQWPRGSGLARKMRWSSNPTTLPEPQPGCPGSPECPWRGGPHPLRTSTFTSPRQVSQLGRTLLPYRLLMAPTPRARRSSTAPPERTAPLPPPSRPVPSRPNVAAGDADHPGALQLQQQQAQVPSNQPPVVRGPCPRSLSLDPLVFSELESEPRRAASSQGLPDNSDSDQESAGPAAQTSQPETLTPGSAPTLPALPLEMLESLFSWFRAQQLQQQQAQATSNQPPVVRGPRPHSPSPDPSVGFPAKEGRAGPHRGCLTTPPRTRVRSQQHLPSLQGPDVRQEKGNSLHLRALPSLLRHLMTSSARGRPSELGSHRTGMCTGTRGDWPFFRVYRARGGPTCSSLSPFRPRGTTTGGRLRFGVLRVPTALPVEKGDGPSPVRDVPGGGPGCLRLSGLLFCDVHGNAAGRWRSARAAGQALFPWEKTSIMPRKRKSSYANTPHAQEMRLRRQSESCDAREERLSRQRQRQTESRQNETLGEHQERQEHDRFRHMVARRNESEEERQQRLIADRNRYQNLRQREIQNAKRSALLYDKNDPCNKAAIGEMTKLCQCGAKKFTGESLGMCCGNGKLTLDQFPPLPQLFEELFTAESSGTQGRTHQCQAEDDTQNNSSSVPHCHWSMVLRSDLPSRVHSNFTGAPGTDSIAVLVMEVQPQRHVRPPRTRANRPEVITSCGRIIGYHEAGKGLQEISRLLGISRDTVRLWVRRHEEEGHVLTRPRPGRPRVTTPAADQQIQRAADGAPLSTTVRITRETGVQCHPITTRRRIRETGGQCFIPARTICLS
ncbi:putative Helix-turn-helix domain-containing protein 2 [Homarus americanus]|uniref:Putative Helix-turn-helix domain-containing protein 2 n=1 Tax=Homarus americanus TaxID=6706 RepID=A0A8J5MQC0_HOMAM|nr:putative Helix-turn-helix domain-containing protein 2 [Homarus americanus]